MSLFSDMPLMMIVLGCFYLFGDSWVVAEMNNMIVTEYSTFGSFSDLADGHVAFAVDDLHVVTGCLIRGAIVMAPGEYCFISI